MANKVFVNDDGIVEIRVDGDQTVASIQVMADNAFQLCQSMREKGDPALILDDIRAIGNVPPEGRKAVVQLVKSGEFERLAMVGSGGVIKLGANLMLQATGKSARVKYFDNCDLATTWLLGK